MSHEVPILILHGELDKAWPLGLDLEEAAQTAI